MNETKPSASQRIASQVRLLRTAGGWDQPTLATLLGALGCPTNTSTVTRIENGDQPITVEQLLLLALTGGPNGLRSLLVPPFTIGGVTIANQDDLNYLLDGRDPVDDNGVTVAAGVELAVGQRVAGLWDARRNQMIADSIMSTPEQVAEVALTLFGRTADQEIHSRFLARLAEVEPGPEPETATWRAYRAHAVRHVQKEIREALR